MNTTLGFNTYRYSLEIGALSDIGRERENNQDNIGYVHFADKRNILALVADGMGGYEGGEVASLTAVQTAQQWFCSHLDNEDIAATLQTSFKAANSAVYQAAQDTPELKGMGTTLVALAVMNGKAYYANTGDSRLYHFRQGQCSQLTQDHTKVAYMVSHKMLTPEDAATHPERHLLTHALGIKTDTKIDVSNQPLPVEAGDSFLLCSDGLYDLVSLQEINYIINQNNAQEACNQLVDIANSQGGYDNISVITIKILTIPKNLKLPITRA